MTEHALGVERHVGRQPEHEHARPRRPRRSRRSARGAGRSTAAGPVRSVRDSTSTKAARRAAAPTKTTTLAAEPHSHRTPPSSRPSRSRVPPAASSTAPSVVDGVLARLDVLVEAVPHHPRGRDAERQVDEEDPTPGQVVGEHPAEGRPDDGGCGPDAGDVALHLRALGHGVDVADDRHAHRLHRAGPEPLHEPEDDERRHAPGDAAQQRAQRRTARCRAASPACGRTGRRPCRRSGTETACASR